MGTISYSLDFNDPTEDIIQKSFDNGIILNYIQQYYFSQWVSVQLKSENELELLKKYIKDTSLSFYDTYIGSLNDFLKQTYFIRYNLTSKKLEVMIYNYVLDYKIDNLEMFVKLYNFVDKSKLNNQIFQDNEVTMQGCIFTIENKNEILKFINNFNNIEFRNSKFESFMIEIYNNNYLINFFVSS